MGRGTANDAMRKFTAGKAKAVGRELGYGQSKQWLWRARVSV